MPVFWFLSTDTDITEIIFLQKQLSFNFLN
jgi:hypothetical protein